MKVIITGATGMIGKGVLLECLDQDNITEVLSISRRSLSIKHPKIKELLHGDFSEFDSVRDQLEGYDACYACMGVSSAGMKEEEYTRLTYGYTMALARTLFQINPHMTFIYVSGQGTDSTESGSMWARVKGKTENDLLKLGFRQAFMFRPGMIIPVKGVSPSSKLYRALINNLTWLLKLMKRLAPNSVVDSAQIGQAMITATQSGYDKKIIAPGDILKLNK
ncbi:NAD-dependent epimerase/dehydratase family protein [Echinicola sp. 20G]|uniref:NAD-dependent epimerase/dehydratase family protein n=1 Tax=Echinicola sp. 20G TaxID=2781961 RepID=UPI001910F1E4|nr:NAD-dependent epimerase/dehydratase family protein [Echinicola sp. 20G]